MYNGSINISHGLMLLFEHLSPFFFFFLGCLSKGPRCYKFGFKSWSGHLKYCCCWKVVGCCSQRKYSSCSSKNFVVDSWNEGSLLQFGLCKTPSFCCWCNDWFTCYSSILEESDGRAIKVQIKLITSFIDFNLNIKLF